MQIHKMKTYFFFKSHKIMSKESLISTRDRLARIYNSCLENNPTSDDLITISNCKCILNQAIKAYEEPEEFIKTRLSHILDYIYKYIYSDKMTSKVYENIQWLIEDIKHYFTDDLRVDYTTGKYMYNSLAPITWRGLDCTQWDYYIIPELILPETKKVQLTVQQLQPAKEPETSKNNTYTASSNMSTNKWVPPFQRKNQQQQSKPRTQYNNDKMAALKAKYGEV